MTKANSVVVGLLLLCLAGATLVAENGDSRREPVGARNGKSNRTAKTKSQLLITPEREAAVMAFVRRHHKDLLDVVLYLKEHLPKDYQKAIRDIYRTQQRLSVFEDRGDLEKHKLELDLWKTQSRAQLLTAEYRMTKNDKILNQIEKLLKRRYELRIMLLKHDRQKFVSRLDKLDQQIGKLKLAQQQSIARQIRLLTRPAKTIPVKTGASRKNTP